MPRTLLLDTNRAAVPLYQALIRKGHEVWVVGKNPEETLAKMAPNYYELDYSDSESITKFIAEKKFDFLVPGCTDISYIMCAKVGAERFFGIDTSEITARINTKNKFKEMLQTLSIPSPRLLSKRQAVEQPSVIVKPVDSFSGKGIHVLNYPDMHDLELALNFACKSSKSQTALIEEFIESQLFSYSCFLQAGEIVAGFFVQEDDSTNIFSVDTSKVRDDVSEFVKESINSDVRKIAKKLGLSNGLVHLQFLCDGSEYWVIEMTRRCPGDIYALLIEYATGYNYAESYIAAFIGETARAPLDLSIKKNIIRHTVTSKPGEIFWGLQISNAINIRLFVPLTTSGEIPRPEERLRLGIIFIETKSKDEQAEIYKKLISRSLYQVGFSGQSDE